jgi:hypothetical protein
MEFWVWLVPFGLLICLDLGFWLGKRAADWDWVVSAREFTPAHRTAHHCGGKFYYVVPESEFVTDWQRKELAPPARP